MARIVAVVGNGNLPPDDPRLSLARRTGAALARAGFVVLTGGRGGVMLAASAGASSVAGRQPVIGILPGSSSEDANPSVDIALPTGLGHSRNALVAHADALVAIGGGAGTLSEIAMAWVFDRVVIAFRTDGWSGRIADTRVDERRRFPDRVDDRVYGVDQPEDVIRLLAALLPGIPKAR
jgi:uncharacterized protein (TIGR00725 family)